MSYVLQKQIEKFVSKNLRERRIALGYSREDLGRVLNISAKQIEKFEEGIIPISGGRLYVLAKFLKVPIKYFFDKNTHKDESLEYVCDDFKNASLNLAENDEGGSFNVLQKNTTAKIRKKEESSLTEAFAEVQNPQIRSIIVQLIQSISSLR